MAPAWLLGWPLGATAVEKTDRLSLNHGSFTAAGAEATAARTSSYVLPLPARVGVCAREALAEESGRVGCRRLVLLPLRLLQ